MAGRATRVGAAASVAAITVHYLVPLGAPRELVYEAIAESAAIVLAITALRRPVSVRGPLLILAGGVQLLVAGDLVWTWDLLVRHVETPVPSVADALYLAGFPVQLVALWWVLRRRDPGRDRGAVLDALVMAAGAGALSWTFVIRAIALDGSVGFAERAVSVAYPAIDVMLLGMVARMLMTRGRRPVAFWWFVVALGAALVADGIYSVQNGIGTYEAGSWLDAGWLISYCAWAVGALHPSSAHLADPVPPPGVERVGAARVAALIVGATTPSVCLLAWMDVAEAADLAVVVIASCLAFGLVVWRLVGVLRSLDAASAELRRSHEERRRLMAELVGATERERIRVAGALHDGPLQALAAIRMDLEIGSMAAEDGDLDEVAAVLARSGESLSAEVASIRAMMSSLRPPVLDERGLAQALEDHLGRVAERHAVAVDASCRVEEALDADTETLLFRVAQEAVSNAVRHAVASRIEVGLMVCDGLAHLRVADDGRGFEPRSTAALMVDGHFGIAGMVERIEMAGGTCTVDSVAGRGTTVVVELAVTRFDTATGFDAGESRIAYPSTP